MKNLTLQTIFKKDSLLLLAKIFVPTLFFLVLLYVFAKIKGIDLSYITRDPIQLLNGKPYTGILSNTGIIFWCFTIAILFFSAKIARNLGRPKILYQFFFFAGLMTLLLLVDDLFLFHDVIFPDYLQLNEIFFYIFYGLSVVALLYFFRKVILESDYVLLLLTFVLLGSSVIMDLDIVYSMGIYLPGSWFIEDGFKFMGIISWFVYFLRICYSTIKPLK